MKKKKKSRSTFFDYSGFYVSRFLVAQIKHIKIKDRIIVTLNINLHRFILINSIKMYKGINIFEEIMIMAQVLH